VSTEPEYRLVADEDEPITLDMLVGPDRAPTIAGDQLSENYGAAERAAEVILSDTRDTMREDSERVIDVLSDLFHLCDLLGLDMDYLVDAAQRNYDAEIRGLL
jgi:hypothetical protein